MTYREKVEQYLGFKIAPRWVVHHINGDHSDNRLKNLCLLPKSLHFYTHRSRMEGLLCSNLSLIRKIGPSAFDRKQGKKVIVVMEASSEERSDIHDKQLLSLQSGQEMDEGAKHRIQGTSNRRRGSARRHANTDGSSRDGGRHPDSGIQPTDTENIA